MPGFLELIVEEKAGRESKELGPKQGTVHNLGAGSYSDVNDSTFVTG